MGAREGCGRGRRAASGARATRGRERGRGRKNAGGSWMGVGLAVDINARFLSGHNPGRPGANFCTGMELWREGARRGGAGRTSVRREFSYWRTVRLKTAQTIGRTQSKK